MSRFRKLSQTIWCCQYHIVFVPKYRFRILIGEVAQEVERCIKAFVDQQKGEIVELNVQIDHVHLLVMIPPIKGDKLFQFAGLYEFANDVPFFKGDSGTKMSASGKDEFKEPESRVAPIHQEKVTVGEITKSGKSPFLFPLHFGGR